jgi:hypothetical protein
MAVMPTTNPAADGGYLFATFRGEHSPLTEQVHFVTSHDGRTWASLNDGRPVLISHVGEQGVRDPFLIRRRDGSGFVLIATDCSIHRNPDWTRAVTAGSKSIVIWESNDLVRWSAPRLEKIAPNDAGCTWAPEAAFDEATHEYIVFWASTCARDRFSKHRIWASRTKDFAHFSEPFLYIDRQTAVIDTTIIAENGAYYRFTKDEEHKTIAAETSERLDGPWRVISEFSLAKMAGFEGPACFPMRDELGTEVWCLLLDHYARGEGYKPFVTTNLAGGQFEPASGFSFPYRLRHGSVLQVTANELDSLTRAFPSTAHSPTSS